MCFHYLKKKVNDYCSFCFVMIALVSAGLFNPTVHAYGILG